MSLTIEDRNKFRTDYGMEIDENNVLIKYSGKETSVTIPEGVVTIGMRAFQNCKKVCEIIIPSTVIQIEAQAFKDCTQLQTLTIPDSVKEIGVSTFHNCIRLLSVKLPSHLTEIPDATFFMCNKLSSIVIPNSVTKIGADAFFECAALEFVVIPQGVAYLGENAFAFCHSIKQIILPKTLIEIGTTAIMGCEKLEIIHIPISVTKFGDRIFRFHSLKSLQYEGTEEQWKKIEKGIGNDYTAIIKFNVPYNCGELVANTSSMSGTISNTETTKSTVINASNEQSSVHSSASVARYAVNDAQIQSNLDKLFAKLGELFPEHKIFAFDSLASHDREKLAKIAKELGLSSYMPILQGYGFEVIAPEQTKQIRNKVIYAPGNEPDVIKNKIDNALKSLAAYYPDKVIERSIQSDHPKLASNLSGLYQWLGYEDLRAFLAVYGYRYNAVCGNKNAYHIKADGEIKRSRKDKNSSKDIWESREYAYNEFVRIAREHFPNGYQCSRVSVLVEACPDLEPFVEDATYYCCKKCDVGLKEYLQSQGIMIGESRTTKQANRKEQNLLIKRLQDEIIANKLVSKEFFALEGVKFLAQNITIAQKKWDYWNQDKNSEKWMKELIKYIDSLSIDVIKNAASSVVQILTEIENIYDGILNNWYPGSNLSYAAFDSVLESMHRFMFMHNAKCLELLKDEGYDYSWYKLYMDYSSATEDDWLEILPFYPTAIDSNGFRNDFLLKSVKSKWTKALRYLKSSNIVSFDDINSVLARISPEEKIYFNLVWYGAKADNAYRDQMEDLVSSNPIDDGAIYLLFKNNVSVFINDDELLRKIIRVVPEVYMYCDDKMFDENLFDIHTEVLENKLSKSPKGFYLDSLKSRYRHMDKKAFAKVFKKFFPTNAKQKEFLMRYPNVAAFEAFRAVWSSEIKSDVELWTFIYSKTNVEFSSLPKTLLKNKQFILKCNEKRAINQSDFRVYYVIDGEESLEYALKNNIQVDIYSVPPQFLTRESVCRMLANNPSNIDSINYDLLCDKQFITDAVNCGANWRLYGSLPKNMRKDEDVWKLFLRHNSLSEMFSKVPLVVQMSEKFVDYILETELQKPSSLLKSSQSVLQILQYYSERYPAKADALKRLADYLSV